MTSAELFPTICGHHWLPVFKNRPRINNLSLQIHERLTATNNPAIFRQLQDRAALDTRKQTAAPGGNGELRTGNPNAGVAIGPEAQQA